MFYLNKALLPFTRTEIMSKADFYWSIFGTLLTMLLIVTGTVLGGKYTLEDWGWPLVVLVPLFVILEYVAYRKWRKA